ncbi:MAG: heme-binding domain-containing protein [Deltaproteobacteria bacterium]|nr:heme-binding domain-containing protein [Deltaproteobacteria bacterium]
MRLLRVLKLPRFPVIIACICASSLITLIGGCSGTGERSSNTPQSEVRKDELAADPQVHQVLTKACFDCHSDQKPAVWNARLAPSYLFGADKARRTLDFSDWPTYPPQRRRAELAAIGKVVQDSSMPPADYDFFHPDAKLSAEQKQLLLHWISQQSATDQR